MPSKYDQATTTTKSPRVAGQSVQVAKAEPLREVPTAVEDIGSALTVLETDLVDLEERLRIALGAESPEDGEATKASVPQSPLGEIMRGWQARIINADQRVRSLSRRVQL